MLLSNITVCERKNTEEKNIQTECSRDLSQDFRGILFVRFSPPKSLTQKHMDKILPLIQSCDDRPPKSFVKALVTISVLSFHLHPQPRIPY